MPILIRKAQRGMMTDLIDMYPRLAKVYGASGENIVIKPDKKFHPRRYGSIEFFQKGVEDVNYNKPNQYKEKRIYLNPGGSTKYGIIYNPRRNNKQDIFLDLLHGMHADPTFNKLKEEFKKAAIKHRGGDMRHFYQKDLEEGTATDGQEQWDENAIDGYLRSELFDGDDNDYSEERKWNSQEMKAIASRIKSYLSGIDMTALDTKKPVVK